MPTKGSKPLMRKSASSAIQLILCLIGLSVLSAGGCNSRLVVAAGHPESDARLSSLPQPVDTHREFTNSIGIKFVCIPAGDFQMGIPDQGWELVEETVYLDIPAHAVRLTKPFYIGAFETTQSQFERVMGYNPSFHSANGEGREDLRGQNTSSYPVESVSWNEAAEFCKRMSELPDERASNRHYRLPTEAEWEYVCRCGQSQPYRLNPEREIDDESGENAGKWEGFLPIQRVGMYPPNTFGVYDMRGNVWEWCQDWYARDYYGHSPSDNPTGPATGVLRIVRGSDWFFSGTERCRLTHSPMPPDQRSQFIGFRVVYETE
jgi:formylglycine-generating enzyme required for sulfatase activity